MSEDLNVSNCKNQRTIFLKRNLKTKSYIWSYNQGYVACCRPDGITWQTVLECINNLQLNQPRFNYHPPPPPPPPPTPPTPTPPPPTPPPQNKFPIKSFHCNALNFCHTVNVDGDSHISQSFLELEIGSELPNCCKCFELSPGDRVKKAQGALALSLILSNPVTPALP